MNDNNPKTDSKHGYHYFEPPSEELLDEHYERKYFQENEIYSKEYSIEEKDFFRSSADRKIDLICQATERPDLQGMKTLEIGYGEGWSLAALKHRGADIIGIDYSINACTLHNPNVTQYARAQKPEMALREMIEQGKSFDLIWLDNVLEHVPNPKELLNTLFTLSNPAGLLIVEVPNDYSALQRLALDKGLIDKEFWLAYPEHLSYFDMHSLKSILSEHGFLTKDCIADFPIDLYLLNPHSNYVTNSETGKGAHRARLFAEQLINSHETNTVLELYRSLAKVGLGRNIINLSIKADKDEGENLGAG